MPLSESVDSIRELTPFSLLSGNLPLAYITSSPLPVSTLAGGGGGGVVVWVCGCVLPDLLKVSVGNSTNK